MDYLRSVLRGILKESAQQNSIIDAIKKKYEVNMTYSPDKNGNGGGERVIQPVAYGTSTEGNPVIRAFQPEGDTSSSVPNWKLFKLDKINNWEPLKDRTFSEPPGFNRNGDKGMSEVLVSSDFGDGSNIVNPQMRQTANNSGNIGSVQTVKSNLKNAVDGMKFNYIKNNQQNSQQQSTLKGNQSSINDMMRTNNFYDGNDTVTDGPIKKDSTEKEQPTVNNTKPDYTNASKNGPVFKGEGDDEDEYEVEDVNNEEEESLEDNGQKQV